MTVKTYQKQPGKRSVDDIAASIIMELFKDSKEQLQKGTFKAGAWMLFETETLMVLQYAPESEIIVAIPEASKRFYISKYARTMLSVAREKADPKTQLYSIIVVADAFVDNFELAPGTTDINEYLKSVNYTRPEQQAHHQEVFLAVASCRDREIAYTHPYCRMNGQVLFLGDGVTERNPRSGFLTKIFPADI